MNLYEETLYVLGKHNKTINDVIAVRGNHFEISIENFIELAKKTDYDNGFGAQMVATDLVVVGSNFWLERHEYDGSEWWEYKAKPNRLLRWVSVNSLVTDSIGWSTLEEINKL